MIIRGCEPLTVPQSTNPARKTVFLDRDGVINIDRGYVSKVEDFEWVDGALDAISILRENLYRIVIVTNQSGVGRGLYTEADFLKLTDWMIERIQIDDVLYCPHAPEIQCIGRKPKIGMFLCADRIQPVSKSESFLIGDKLTDLEAASNFGIRGEIFEGGNLAQLVNRILGL